MNKYIAGFKGLFSKTPTYIIFYVTARCNARCKMCFYWREIGQAEAAEELSLNEIEKISRSFGFLQYITLTGGEPSLRGDLPKIARIFDRNNRVQFISIPTNSILTDRIKEMVEEILKTTKHPYLKLCLSLDGLGKDHDEIRGVPGCFEKVVANYHNLAKLKKTVKDFEIMVNMTVSKFNKDKVKEVMDFVRQEMPLAVFDFCWTRGDAKEKESKEMTAEDYRRVSETVNQEENNFSRGFSFARLIAANKMAAHQIIEQILRGKKRNFSCSVGRKMVIISENGLVKPCEMLDFDFGNLRNYDYDIKKILSTEKAKEILKFIKQKKCFCTFENAIQNSLINNPTQWPLLFKKMFLEVNFRGFFSQQTKPRVTVAKRRSR